MATSSLDETGLTGAKKYVTLRLLARTSKAGGSIGALQNQDKYGRLISVSTMHGFPLWIRFNGLQMLGVCSTQCGMRILMAMVIKLQVMGNQCSLVRHRIFLLQIHSAAKPATPPPIHPFSSAIQIMDILLAVTLLAILIKCATASTSIMAEFCEVVHKGDMDKAVELHQSIKGHSASCLNYVVATKDQKFIFEFAKQAQIERSVLLASLHRKKKPRRMIEEAFRVFKFNQSDLVEVASKSDLMCSDGRLIDTLGKIEKREDQKMAIRNGVKNLFNLDHTDHAKYTACLDPLLEAFESQESLRHLKDVLSKTAFIRGSMKGIKPVVEYLYDDPAVTPGIYAQGLIVSKKRDMVTPPIFCLKKPTKMI